jgi:hypothetical protein
VTISRWDESEFMKKVQKEGLLSDVWVKAAEKKWESVLWASILYKTAQHRKHPLPQSELNLLKVCDEFVR